MRVTHQPGKNSYESNGRWAECDRCGFDYRLKELRRDGETGVMVCPKCYDSKHPRSSKR